ncbi:phosphate-starvation-inducible PsiE family protein [Microbulbifer pacificus]|uniref:Phosphate-starvation-inducible PsiE family protein n=1 Tax=Microbulbifer pacificus TaxID=407164 RepID=A0AAU0MZT3_9GAMM|nr:phosphate-starvation-inducible PsiE family protein [Microbulbifer pacificus]WOX05339.1 phosphate-starvation-inducible PsiE family protein [Microbulbifer pacificus]
MHEELPTEHEDRLIRYLHRIIRVAVRFLAILMSLVIVWGAIYVLVVLYERLSFPPVWILDSRDILDIFGSFLVVLIAVEIFVNIRLYLGTNIIPMQLVVATALMAMARKIIVLDPEKVSPMYVFGFGVVIFALGITYWVVSKSSNERDPDDE